MLADAEETPGVDGNKGNVDEGGVEPPAEPPVRRKAKTKIGNKTKKKKKTKTTSKFPDGEEGLQVELSSTCLCVHCCFKRACNHGLPHNNHSPHTKAWRFIYNLLVDA